MAGWDGALPGDVTKVMREQLRVQCWLQGGSKRKPRIETVPLASLATGFALQRPRSGNSLSWSIKAVASWEEWQKEERKRNIGSKGTAFKGVRGDDGNARWAPLFGL